MENAMYTHDPGRTARYLPLGLFLGLLGWTAMRALGRRRGGGGLSDRPRRTGRGTPTVTLEDVAGIREWTEESRDSLGDIIWSLRNPKEYQRTGKAIPKGVLLVGGSDRERRLLAKAIAGEAGVPFFVLSGSELAELPDKPRVSRVDKLFEQARREAPSVVFVEDLDSFGRNEGTDRNRRQLRISVMMRMSALDPRDAVVVLASTSHPDELDRGLLGPLRFERRIVLR